MSANLGVGAKAPAALKVLSLTKKSKGVLRYFYPLLVQFPPPH